MEGRAAHLHARVPARLHAGLAAAGAGAQGPVGEARRGAAALSLLLARRLSRLPGADRLQARALHRAGDVPGRRRGRRAGAGRGLPEAAQNGKLAIPPYMLRLPWLARAGGHDRAVRRHPDRFAACAADVASSSSARPSSRRCSRSRRAAARKRPGRRLAGDERRRLRAVRRLHLRPCCCRRSTRAGRRRASPRRSRRCAAASPARSASSASASRASPSCSAATPTPTPRPSPAGWPIARTRSPSSRTAGTPIWQRSWPPAEQGAPARLGCVAAFNTMRGCPLAFSVYVTGRAQLGRGCNVPARYACTCPRRSRKQRHVPLPLSFQRRFTAPTSALPLTIASMVRS